MAVLEKLHRELGHSHREILAALGAVAGAIGLGAVAKYFGFLGKWAGLGAALLALGAGLYIDHAAGSLLLGFGVFGLAVTVLGLVMPSAVRAAGGAVA